MTDEPPIRSATPDDIEAALQSVRAQLLPPDPVVPVDAPIETPAEPRRTRPRRRSWFWTGLLVAAAALAGAIATALILRSQIDDLTRRLAIVEGHHSGDTSMIDDVPQRLSALENLVERRLLRNAALAIVVSRLTAASESGRPFVTELNAVQQIAPEIDLSPFQPAAAGGIPSTVVLAAELATLDPAVARPTSVWAAIWTAIAGRDDRTPANSPYAQARRSAAMGDLHGAVQILRQMPPPLSPELERWLAAAEQRQTFDTALAALSASLLRDLTRQVP